MRKARNDRSESDLHLPLLQDLSAFANRRIVTAAPTIDTIDETDQSWVTIVGSCGP